MGYHQSERIGVSDEIARFRPVPTRSRMVRSVRWAFLASFPVRCVAERVRGSEEKPQVRRGGATGASAGANHTSAR